MHVALGLGANLGHPAQNIHTAFGALRNLGLRDAILSPLYETLPVDCLPGTPNFINAAVTGRWPRPLIDLLPACKQIEESLGRPRDHSSREARMIDLDIVLAEVGSINLPGLRIPHPQVHNRLFVLLPLRDIVPDWIVPPEQLTVAELARRRLAESAHPPPVWRLSEKTGERAP